MFFGNQNNGGGRSSGGKDLGDEVEGYLMGRHSQTSKFNNLNNHNFVGNNSYDEYKE